MFRSTLIFRSSPQRHFGMLELSSRATWHLVALQSERIKFPKFDLKISLFKTHCLTEYIFQAAQKIYPSSWNFYSELRGFLHNFKTAKTFILKSNLRHSKIGIVVRRLAT